MTYLIRCVLTFSKETFFEARKARINLGRPEMEKRKEKKRRREEKIFVINGDQDLWIGRVVGAAPDVVRIFTDSLESRSRDGRITYREVGNRRSS